MARSSLLYLAPKARRNETQDPAIAPTLESVSQENFVPTLSGTVFGSAREKRCADVIHSTDLLGEVAELKRLAITEGLSVMDLKFNGVELRVHKDATDAEVIENYLNQVGKRVESGFELNSSMFEYLDNAVYSACAASQLINNMPRQNVPVFFTFETVMSRYEPATVNKDQTPDEVFEQMKPKLWYQVPKGVVKSL